MEAGSSDFRHSKPYTGLRVGRRLGHESVKLEGLAARSRFAGQTQRQLEQEKHRAQLTNAKYLQEEKAQVAFHTVDMRIVGTARDLSLHCSCFPKFSISPSP